MSRSFDDRVASEVNKRLTIAASSAGVDRGRVEIEVLFLLPPEFVRRYRELFDRALADPIKPATDGGKDEGRLRATGKPADPMKARSMGAAAPGKKFVAGAWPVRDEHALEVKKRLDKKLVKLVIEALGLVVADPGLIRAGATMKLAQPPRCSDCGLFQKPDWKRCPYH